MTENRVAGHVCPASTLRTMGITVSTVLRASIRAHLLRSTKLHASTVMLDFTVITQTRSYMDLIVACNARRTAPAGLVRSLGMATTILHHNVRATLAMLYSQAILGIQQKVGDYLQSSCVSHALQARISLMQCNGEKSNTRRTQCILLV